MSMPKSLDVFNAQIHVYRQIWWRCIEMLIMQKDLCLSLEFNCDVGRKLSIRAKLIEQLRI